MRQDPKLTHLAVAVVVVTVTAAVAADMVTVAAVTAVSTRDGNPNLLKKSPFEGFFFAGASELITKIFLTPEFLSDESQT